MAGNWQTNKQQREITADPVGSIHFLLEVGRIYFATQILEA